MKYGDQILEPTPPFRDEARRKRAIRAVVEVLRSYAPEALKDPETLATPVPISEVDSPIRMFDRHLGRLDWKLRDHLAIDIVATPIEISEAIQETDPNR